MSLATLAVRICTVYALRGRTIAGANVADSPQNPLPENISAPTVAVYTGAGSVKACGTDIPGGDFSTSLSVNIHLPTSFAVDGTEGPVKLAARDAGSELAFDLFWRQVSSALMNDESEWADLWRTFVTDIKSIDTMPFLIELDNRVRIAARDFSFDLETISDPPPGQIDEDSPWRRFIDACMTEPELAPLVPVLIAAIEQPAAINPERAAVGLSYDEFAAIGLAPIVTGEADPISEITIADDQAGNVIVTEETQNLGP